MAPAFKANASSSTRWRPMISTVASEDLREILEDWRGRPSALARKTINYQLKAYGAYISAPRRVPNHLTSLVDLAAHKIPEAELDTLDDIPDSILSSHIWRWRRMSYSLFRGALTRLSPKSAKPPKKRRKTETTGATGDIDEW
ncbi:hypothetical protein MVEN_01970600 [Mycena venus]|uniref:Uncharacterized protein n=1 Tax=Mycena venus TaxID=2733690 RepID=A0A8H6XEE6_9AGAR|nr:hypothetical protein MVEN_01970600 [Mycena venus]